MDTYEVMVKVDVIAETGEDAEAYVEDVLMKETAYGLGLKTMNEDDGNDEDISRIESFEIMDWNDDDDDDEEEDAEDEDDDEEYEDDEEEDE